MVAACTNTLSSAMFTADTALPTHTIPCMAQRIVHNLVLNWTHLPGRPLHSLVEQRAHHQSRPVHTAPRPSVAWRAAGIV